MISDVISRCVGGGFLMVCLWGPSAVAQPPTPPLTSPTAATRSAVGVPGDVGVPGEMPSEAEPQGLVLGVTIRGNRTITESQIRRNIKTRKQRAYDPQLVQEDLRRLYATRWFHNIRVDKNVTPQGIYLTFEVLERPTMEEVLFIGNQYLTDKKLLKESGLKTGDALNIYTVQEARRKVEEYYRTNGFSRTSVTIVEGDKPRDRRIVLRIDEGPLERIWDVRFVGNDPGLVTDARLKSLIKSKPGFLKYLFRGTVNHELIEQDRQLLTVYYRNLGYFKAQISRELEFDESGNWATLTFVIDEGPRYRIGDLRIVGNQSLDGQAVRERLMLKAGDYFNMEKLQHDENSLRESYGGIGHIFADVKTSLQFREEPGLLDLVYRIDEGGLFRVGKINIHVAGEFPHTRRRVILNRLSLHPGDIVNIRDVRDSERRLKASQLFINSPSEGTPPRIVIRPPNLAEAATMARSASPTYRGQNPGDAVSAGGMRNVILDVYVPASQFQPR